MAEIIVTTYRGGQTDKTWSKKLSPRKLKMNPFELRLKKNV